MCDKVYWGDKTPVLKTDYHFRKKMLADSYAVEKGTENPKLTTIAKRSFKWGRLINIFKNGKTEYTFIGYGKGGSKFIFTLKEN